MTSHVRPSDKAMLRPPSEVMRLSRMGAFFPTRLSFMRSLIRRLAHEGARVTRAIWDIDDQGYGCAVYTVPLQGRDYSLVAFSNPLPAEDRTDRVIAEAWDTTYVLYDGVPSGAALDRLRQNTPRQEAGRFDVSELVLARANKSVRLFEHVVDRLANGRQPDSDLIRDIGYLMRTTAVYGNGKFGIADRAELCDRDEMDLPFRAEMLTVWLIRGFTLDLAEHVARQRAPDQAVPLAPHLRRHLGIGNATGLGMAPFLVHHPLLINNWMVARETALARVRAIEHAPHAQIARFLALVDRARAHFHEWVVDDARQMTRIETLRAEWEALIALASLKWLTRPMPWDRLITHAARWSVETQEALVALVLEPHGALIDDLAATMSTDAEPHLQPKMTIDALRSILESHFGWIKGIDFTDSHAQQHF
ncbi:MAG: hypothetical protein AAGP08_10405, partial [Pseudomonadota bacterium]